jgi:hypothetical protein
MGAANDAYNRYMAEMQAYAVSNPRGINLLSGVPLIRAADGTWVPEPRFNDLQIAAVHEREPWLANGDSHNTVPYRPYDPNARLPPIPSQGSSGSNTTQPSVGSSGGGGLLGGSPPAQPGGGGSYIPPPPGPPRTPVYELPPSGVPTSTNPGNTGQSAAPWSTGRVVLGNNQGNTNTMPAPNGISGLPWQMGGSFSGTHAPFFMPRGIDNWNPNDPRAQNPGQVTRSDGTVSFRPRQFADSYGGGVQLPYNNAYQQYTTSLMKAQPIMPSFGWASQRLPTRTPIGMNGNFSAALYGGLLGGSGGTPR